MNRGVTGDKLSQREATPLGHGDFWVGGKPSDGRERYSSRPFAILLRSCSGHDSCSSPSSSAIPRMSPSMPASRRPDVVSSRDIVREIHAIACDLARQVAVASTATEAASTPSESPAMAKVRYELLGLGESVARLRWLSMALVSAELEMVASTVDLGALLSECLAGVRPAFPSGCECTSTVQSNLTVQTDPAVLAEALSLLLNAASLRLRDVDRSGTPTELTLNWHGRAGGSVLHLAYSAPHGGPLKAHANETLALKVFRSFGGQVFVRGTRRWSIFRIRFPLRVIKVDRAT
jgi:hypothetical protein